MTATTAPNARSQLAKEAKPIGPFVVRLAADRVYFGTRAPGQCVLITETTGTVLTRAHEAYAKLEQAS